MKMAHYVKLGNTLSSRIIIKKENLIKKIKTKKEEIKKTKTKRGEIKIKMVKKIGVLKSLYRIP